MNAIADERYVRFTTFTKAGGAKPAPVWIADLGDGTIGFTTGLEAWKVKRIRNTPKVELVASNMKGRVNDGAETVTGTATVVTGAEFETVQKAIKAKYGWQLTMTIAMAKVGKLFGRGGEASNCGIVVTLD